MGLSLRTKWTAALLFTGAVPLALLAYRTTAIQRKGLGDAERQLEVSVLDEAAAILDRAVKDTEEANHRVGRVLTDGSIGDDDARLALARDMAKGAELASMVAVYTAEGGLVVGIARDDASRAQAIDPLDAAALAVKEPRWLTVHRAGAVDVRYVEPVSHDGVVSAWVVTTVDVAALDVRLVGLSEDRFEGRHDGVMLVDDATRILAGGGGGPFAVGQSLAGRDLLASQKLGTQALRTDIGMSMEFTSASGEAMSGSIRPLPTSGWALVVRRSQAAAYAQLAASRRDLGISAGGFALLALLLGAVLAARTTRPIGDLVGLTHAYAKRRFADRSPVRTGDELETLGTSLEKMADDLAASEIEIERRTTAVTNLSRYLPGEVATSIAEGKAKLELGGERRTITVLFADVVSFTTFAEGAEPERVVAFLNELFSVLTEVVFRHGGTVDKFVGDCVMAFFGAPTPSEAHAKRALAAAEDMHRFVESNAPAWKEAYGVDVRLGIGVNSGEAIVGNLGSEARMDYTAIGDVVNVAARLEALAQPGQTLLTDGVVALAGDGFEVHALGEHPLRGKRQAVKVYELR